jgi:uncharacterized SAM-binding protein YcdF (DUF218 family)
MRRDRKLAGYGTLLDFKDNRMDLLAYTLKKIVSVFIYPVGFSLLLWLMGMALWIAGKKNRICFAFFAGSGAILFVMSLPITSFSLFHNLESKAGTYADPSELSRQGVHYVVVLGGDVRTGDLTPADRIASTSLIRTLEGIRLWKRIPGAKLVFSGGSDAPGVMTTAEGMAAFAYEMGIPQDATILESRSLDTEQEARLLKPLLANQKFALVTSASHMNRALVNFRHVGLDPIPAPSDFRGKTFVPTVVRFFPRANALAECNTAIHEYLGTLFLWLKNGGNLGTPKTIYTETQSNK